MVNRAIPLNLGNPGDLAKIKAQIDLIYQGLRQLNVLAPHSVYLHKDDILAALGIVRQGANLIEDPNLDGAERTGLLFYLMPTEGLMSLSGDALKSKIFLTAPPAAPNGASSITLAMVAANDNLENFENQGAYLSTKECPPSVDCPPWHTPPPIQ